VVQVIKATLVQRKADKKPKPVAFFDDIHNVLMAERTTPETIQAASNFCTNLLEWHIAGLLATRLMSSKFGVLAILKASK
jgi:hypothetical protein